MQVVYPKVIRAHPEILVYLPDPEEGKSYLPSREFFFGIFAALKPQEFEKIVREAATQKPTENLQE